VGSIAWLRPGRSFGKTKIKLNYMKKNVGKYDRALRLVFAVFVFVLAYIDVIPGGWNIITWCVGGILLFTAASGRCPLYSACGVDTRSHHASGTGGPTGTSGKPGTPAGGPASPKVS
jgi:hypothetical protein